MSLLYWKWGLISSTKEEVTVKTKPASLLKWAAREEKAKILDTQNRKHTEQCDLDHLLSHRAVQLVTQ